jgi:hypothetical protein
MPLTGWLGLFVWLMGEAVLFPRFTTNRAFWKYFQQVALALFPEQQRQGKVDVTI